MVRQSARSELNKSGITNIKLIQEFAQTGLVSSQVERGVGGRGVFLSHDDARRGMEHCANGGKREDEGG